VTSARPLEIPHTFFGVTARAGNDESGALHEFIINGIRQGRPFQPLVTYNTWFPYGTQVNEDQMVAEIDRAAALGVELVVLDAGWYVGAGDTNDYDFESGSARGRKTCSVFRRASRASPTTRTAWV
jgi:hypothetical protein